MKTPILDEINKMKNKKHISFHTPGHKGLNTIIDWKEYIPYADLTEIGDLDNLQNPEGIIKESQAIASDIFKSKETFYSINGTTGAIYIGMAALTKENDTVLIQRNSHKSVYNSCILNKLDIEYINPKIEDNIFTTINPEDIEEKLQNNKNIKLVVITHPNYYGIVSDIEKISEIVRKYNRYLLVDEAHGSHFIFSEKLPKSSLEYDVDIVVQSTHKTLPSFTQTSMLHIGSNRVDRNKIREYINIYQSTSPSYLFMLSLEITSNYMNTIGREKLNKNIDIIENLIYKYKDLEDINIYSKENKDITKILFSLGNYTGKEIEEEFIKNNIYLEMSDPYYALALSTVMNEEKDFIELFNTMEKLSLNKKGKIKNKNIKEFNFEIKKAYPIYKAFNMEGKLTELDSSINKISKSFITPYPPGIPILVPGELITKEILEKIIFYKNNDIEILGLKGKDKDYIEIV